MLVAWISLRLREPKLKVEGQNQTGKMDKFDDFKVFCFDRNRAELVTGGLYLI